MVSHGSEYIILMCLFSLVFVVGANIPAIYYKTNILSAALGRGHVGDWRLM